MITKPKIAIDLNEVERLSGQGLTRQQIADALGISATTLYDRQRESAEFVEALNRGRAKSIGNVTSKLMELVDEKNLGAIAFYLKCRAGWRETSQLELSGRDGGPVEMSVDCKKMTTEQLMAIATMEVLDESDTGDDPSSAA